MYKGKNKEDPNKCKPKLTFIKILEKVVHEQMSIFIKENVKNSDTKLGYHQR